MGSLTEQYRQATMSKSQLESSTTYTRANYSICCRNPRVQRTLQDTEPKFQCISCQTHHNTPSN